jgi:ligand-binding sensor domain-containing protein
MYLLIFGRFDTIQYQRFNEFLLILKMRKLFRNQESGIRNYCQSKVVDSPWFYLSVATFFIFHFSFFITTAQIPLNTWRTHFSYQDTRGVELANRQLYCFSGNGLFYVNTSDNQIVTLSKQNGLSETQIRSMAFSTTAQQLIIGYESGNIDVLKTDLEGRPIDFQNIPVIKNAEQITGSKRISQVVVNGNDALLACDFGIVRFDILRSEIKETYRNLGTNGASVAIYNLTFANDSIFARTSGGLLAARYSPNINLQFYGNWHKVATPEPTQFDYIQAIGTQIFVAFNTKLYSYEKGRWSILKNYNTAITSLNVSNNRLLIGLLGRITTLNGDIWVNTDLNNPQATLNTPDGATWVATSQKGLLRNQNNQIQSLSPSSPQFSIYPKLFATPESIIALSIQNKGFDVFSAQKWGYNALSANVKAATRLNDGRVVMGANEGAFVKNINGSIEQMPNSPTTITDLTTDREGNIWACTSPSDFNSPNLYVQKSSTVWQSFSISNRQLSHILIDDNGYKWLLNTNNEGILVFDDKTNRTKQLTTVQNNGNLPSNTINTFVKDKDGAIWIGTDRGVAVFDNATVFGGVVNAYTPIFERRKLLANEYITCFAIDGGNNKWIGTRNGLFRFGPDGTTLLEQFNEQNSPLSSNLILNLSIEPIGGEVFVSTSKGLVSYQATASEPIAALSTINIFPNPVRPEFSGLVGMKGLSENATVKITDLSGRLVFETRSQGGTASWNLSDYEGNRAKSGVYLVIVTDANGQESIAGKLAVVR